MASRAARGATRTWSSWAWVHRIARTCRSPTTAEDRVHVVRRVDHHALAVVADHPDVVVDVEGLPVEAERARGDARGRSRAGPAIRSTTTERSTSPWCIRSNASSTSSSADLLGDERVEVEPALQVQVDQHREVPAGQAVAVPARLERAAAAEDVEQRQLGDLHLRRRHADQDDGAGQVAGVERLLPRLRSADRVDHHVGAEAAGELPGSPRPGRSRCCSRCAWRRAPRPSSSFRSSMSTAMIVPAPARRRPGDRRRPDAAAADHRDRVAAGRRCRC